MDQVSKNQKLTQMLAEQRRACEILGKRLGWVFYPASIKMGFDGWFYAPTHNIPVVMKCRSFPSTLYGTTLVEKGKISKMAKAAKKSASKETIYAEQFSDGVIIYYKMEDQILEWKWEEMNENTLDSRKEKTGKWVAHIPYSNATHTHEKLCKTNLEIKREQEELELSKPKSQELF